MPIRIRILGPSGEPVAPPLGRAGRALVEIAAEEAVARMEPGLALGQKFILFLWEPDGDIPFACNSNVGREEVLGMLRRFIARSEAGEDASVFDQEPV